MRGVSSRRSRRGQALVEMAFVSLMFFFLVFGVVEFGRALYNYNSIVQSTRAAARWAVVNVGGNGDTADIDRTKNVVVYNDPDVSSGPPILTGLTTALVQVTVVALESDGNGRPITQKVSVRVSGFQFRPVLPITGPITLPAFETALYTESMGVVPS